MTLTAEALLREAVRALRDTGGEAGSMARREARLLLAAVLEVDPLDLLSRPERRVDEDHARDFRDLVARRTAGAPVSRLLGHREFWGLSFALSPDTLDPRPDTETLVRAVLDTIPDRAAPVSLLDLGTGSGCILLSLLSELPNARGLGLDLAPGAVETARANAASLGLQGRVDFVRADWAECGWRGESFDRIVSNPPYVESAVIETLAPEVARHDPRLALDGGADGLAAYRTLTEVIGVCLAPGGRAMLEIGAGQAEAVADLFSPAFNATISLDLAGIGRCVTLTPMTATTGKKTIGLGGATF